MSKPNKTNIKGNPVIINSMTTPPIITDIEGSVLYKRYGEDELWYKTNKSDKKITNQCPEKIKLQKGDKQHPSISFVNYEKTGFYLHDGVLYVVSDGVDMLSILSTIKLHTPIALFNGDNKNPSLLIGDYGIYENEGINFCLDEIPFLNINERFITTTCQMTSADGNVESPSYSFTSDTNIGMYKANTHELGFATAGQEKLLIHKDYIRPLVPIRSLKGSPIIPQYSFQLSSNSGMYFRNHVGISYKGHPKLEISDNILVNTPLIANNASQKTPQYSFNANPTAGMFLDRGVVGITNGLNKITLTLDDKRAKLTGPLEITDGHFIESTGILFKKPNDPCIYWYADGQEYNLLNKISTPLATQPTQLATQPSTQLATQQPASVINQMDANKVKELIDASIAENVWPSIEEVRQNITHNEQNMTHNGQNIQKIHNEQFDKLSGVDFSTYDEQINNHSVEIENLSHKINLTEQSVINMQEHFDKHIQQISKKLLNNTTGSNKTMKKELERLIDLQNIQLPNMIKKHAKEIVESFAQNIAEESAIVVATSVSKQTAKEVAFRVAHDLVKELTEEYARTSFLKEIDENYKSLITKEATQKAKEVAGQWSRQIASTIADEVARDVVHDLIKSHDQKVMHYIDSSINKSIQDQIKQINSQLEQIDTPRRKSYAKIIQHLNQIDEQIIEEDVYFKEQFNNVGTQINDLTNKMKILTRQDKKKSEEFSELYSHVKNIVESMMDEKTNSVVSELVQKTLNDLKYVNKINSLAQKIEQLQEKQSMTETTEKIQQLNTETTEKIQQLQEKQLNDIQQIQDKIQTLSSEQDLFEFKRARLGEKLAEYQRKVKQQEAIIKELTYNFKSDVLLSAGDLVCLNKDGKLVRACPAKWTEQKTIPKGYYLYDDEVELCAYNNDNDVMLRVNVFNNMSGIKLGTCFNAKSFIRVINQSPKRYVIGYGSAQSPDYITIQKIRLDTQDKLPNLTIESTINITLKDIENFAMEVDKSDLTDILVISTISSMQSQLTAHLVQLNSQNNKDMSYGNTTECDLEEYIIEYGKTMILYSMPGQAMLCSYGNLKIYIMLPSNIDGKITFGNIKSTPESHDCIDLIYDIQTGLIITVEQNISDSVFISVWDIGIQINRIHYKFLPDNMYCLPLLLAKTPHGFILFYADAKFDGRIVAMLLFWDEKIILGPKFTNRLDMNITFDNTNMLISHSSDKNGCYIIWPTSKILVKSYINTSYGPPIDSYLGFVQNNGGVEEDIFVSIRGQCYNTNVLLPEKWIGKKLYYIAENASLAFPHNLTLHPHNNVFVGRCLSRNKILVGM